MGSLRWLGKALDVAEVQKITVGGTWASTETLTLTVNGKNIVIILGTDVSTAQVATAIKEAWNGDTQTGTGDHTFSETGNNIPEFNEITATVSGSVVTLTHDTKGIPFTLSLAETSTSGTLTPSTTTAGTGKHFWDNADNWDTGAVPVNSDDVFIDNNAVSIKYGLAQSAVTLTSLTIGSTYTGEIGLPEVNSTGSEDYVEYRARYLNIKSTTVTIGRGDGTGSGRILLNTDSAQTTLNVVNTGTSVETNVPALIWKGTHASNEVNISAGSVGIGFFGGESATVATLRIGGDGVGGRPDVHCGSTVTMTTLTMSDGDVFLSSGLTTVDKRGGTLTIYNGNVTTLNERGGITYYMGAGTLTTVNIDGGGLVNCDRDLRGRTFTNTSIYEGGSLISRQRTITFSNAPQLVRCGLGQVTLELGENISLGVTYL